LCQKTATLCRLPRLNLLSLSLSLSQYEQDCERLAELTGGAVDFIYILGGEPLLHPQITGFLDVSRKSFCQLSRLQITTNGILLATQPKEFWNNCRKNKVNIYISGYPVKIDKDKIESMANEYGIDITFGTIDEKWYALSLDMAGKQNPKRSFTACGEGNWCIQLKNGKLYTCAIISNIQYFNHHFGKNIPVTERDYIDIYKAKNLDEILDFLRSPMPFCRYCDVANRRYNLKWRATKRDIAEWVALP
jgi:MoaA/NifB/PqqE/SkfB family radical SAM enzyme